MGFNVLDLLLPRETKFFKFLNEQVHFLVEGTTLFNKLVTSLDKLSEQEIKQHLVAIKDLESRGDATERHIIDELNKTFITPIDREDIHTLAINIDRSLDILNSISRKIEIYRIRKVPPKVLQFAQLICEIANQLQVCLIEFAAKKNIKEIVERMHKLENEADELFHASMAELFTNETTPLEVIKFKEFYEHLEAVVDSIDYIGKLIRGFKVKQG